MADPVATARELATRARELAPTIERERQLPRELVDELVRGGMMHLLVPRSLGGSETDPVPAAQAVEEISLGDGSAGWCVMLAAQSAAWAGFLPEEHGRAIWGDGGILAGTARPIGRAVATQTPADGYVVSGRWPFASGSSHATWFTGECVVYDGEQPRTNASGDEVTRAVFVPASEVTLHDTWHTTGLRGTASNDFSIDGSFVPVDRGFQVLVDPPVHPWALYQNLGLVFMNHGSHALGVARGAVAEAVQLAGSKKGWGDQPLSSMPRIQTVIAEATVLVESARRFMYGTADDLWSAVQQGDADTTLLRSRLRLAASHAATASIQAVDLVHAALGTTSIFTANPIERQFRDIHTAGAHVMIGPLTYEAAGRVELGLDAAFPFF